MKNVFQTNLKHLKNILEMSFLIPQKHFPFKTFEKREKLAIKAK